MKRTDRKKTVVGIAVVLLVAVSSMVYAGNQKGKDRCPCKAGLTPPGIGPEAYRRTECKWVKMDCRELPHCTGGKIVCFADTVNIAENVLRVPGLSGTATHGMGPVDARCDEKWVERRLYSVLQ